jgi:hypothetical protein
MRVTTDAMPGGGERVASSYTYRSNGRGPDIEERFATDAAGVPVRYEVRGKATFGADIREDFTLAAAGHGIGRHTHRAGHGALHRDREVLAARRGCRGPGIDRCAARRRGLCRGRGGDRRADDQGACRPPARQRPQRQSMSGRRHSIAEADLARSRNWNFWILPVLVFGIGSKRTSRGTL